MPQVPPQTHPAQFGAHCQQYVPNGSVPGMPPQPVQLPPQKVIEKAGVRILCIADVSGMNSELLCYVDFGDLRVFGNLSQFCLDQHHSVPVMPSPLLHSHSQQPTRAVFGHTWRQLFEVDAASLQQCPHGLRMRSPIGLGDCCVTLAISGLRIPFPHLQQRTRPLSTHTDY